VWGENAKTLFPLVSVYLCVAPNARISLLNCVFVLIVYSTTRLKVERSRVVEQHSVDGRALLLVVVIRGVSTYRGNQE